MGFFFLDDSSHPEAGFSVTSFVFSHSDPQRDIESLLIRHRLTPGKDEYKSSTRMDHNSAYVAIREDLKEYLSRNCKVGVAISKTRDDIYQDASRLLQKMLKHPDIGSGHHQVFVDQGIFPTHEKRAAIERIDCADSCTFNYEQDSKKVYGIQLADLSAHVCAIMMKDSLGLITKKVKSGENSGYDPDSEMELGFEMFATIRYAFLGVFAPYIEEPSNRILQPMLMISDYGLEISSKLDDKIHEAAKSRFESLYLGCIH